MTAEARGCATLLFPIVCIGVPFWLVGQTAAWFGLDVQWQCALGLAAVLLTTIAMNRWADRQRRGR